MKMNLRMACGGAAAAMAFALSAPATAQLNQAVNEAENATTAAAASQARIDALEEQRGDLFREFSAVQQRIDSQTLFVERQRIFLQSQENELADLQQQIGEVENVLNTLAPMQTEMIARLEEAILADLPFLREERLERVERLRDLMAEPPTNVPPAEKYRKIIEAYEIETDYGRFLRSWEAPLFQDPELGPAPDAPTVDYFLVGRVAFMYLTKDGNEAAIWDADAGAWETLSGSLRSDLRKGIRIAKEVTTPDVFMVPVPGVRGQE